MSSFIKPFLDEIRAKLDDIEADVETRAANIMRELEGITQAAKRGKSATNPASSSTRAKGEKRTPEALERDTEHVFTVIKAHPGERIEKLAVHAAMSTKEMVLPIRKLRAAKRITAQGAQRATTYTAKGGK